MSDTGRTVDHQGEEEPPEGLYRYDRTANKRVSSIADVTEEDLGFFREHGYLVIDEFLDEAEVEAAKEGMLTLLTEANAGNTEYDLSDVVQFEDALEDDFEYPEAVPPEELQYYVRKFMWYTDHSEGMRAPSECEDLLDLLSTLVEGEPEMFQDMALIKPPDGREKPWHQDKAYFDMSLDAPVVGVWIALDPATAENGCMHVIPDTHKDGPVVHFDRRDWQICDTDVQVDEDVMVPLEPGGALLFDGFIHHGTPPNRSDQLRRALQFHYTAADAEWLEERPDVFGNADKDVEC
ncbi:MAG: phytanoyl-CoA dioxygenase family protein [Halobacteriales archaeon]